jgi:hyaluronan synthase
MIFALEYNGISIRKRQERAKQRPERNSSYVACCIGYKEVEETFESCLRSYKTSAPGCVAYFTMLDGSFDENATMASVFDKEFDTGPEHRISYERALGEMWEGILQDLMNAKDNKKTYDEASTDAHDQVYEYVKERLVVQLQLQASRKGMPAMLISQPHVGLKEVRFAAWMTSIVLADLLKVDYMWSSDSDSCVMPGCISDCVAALVGDDQAGAASAMLVVRNWEQTFFSRLHGGYYQSESALQRVAYGCVGKNNCIQGPSGCYRIEAIRPILFEWYAQRVLGRKVVSEGT